MNLIVGKMYKFKWSFVGLDTSKPYTPEVDIKDCEDIFPGTIFMYMGYKETFQDKHRLRHQVLIEDRLLWLLWGGSELDNMFVERLC